MNETTMDVSTAVNAVGNLKHIFRAFERIEEVLQAAAGAEAGARAAEAQRVTVLGELEAIKTATRLAAEERDRNRKGEHEERVAAAVVLREFQAECVAKREALAKEVEDLTRQRDALTAAVDALRAAAAKV